MIVGFRQVSGFWSQILGLTAFHEKSLDISIWKPYLALTIAKLSVESRDTPLATSLKRCDPFLEMETSLDDKRCSIRALPSILFAIFI